jgi:hypothetical protein
MRLLMLTLALIAFAAPAFADCDAGHQASKSSTIATTSPPPPPTSSGG